MLSWILLILVLVALVAFGIWFWGVIFGRGEVLPPMDEPATVIADNREHIRTGEVENVRFELVTRGYRPEQVDDALLALSQRAERAEEKLREHGLALPEQPESVVEAARMATHTPSEQEER